MKKIIVKLSELFLFIKAKDNRETKEYVLRGQVNKALFFTFFYVLIVFNPITTEAGLIDDVTIDKLADGYEVTIHFEFSIRYQSHTPDKTSDFFRIELVPVNLNGLEGIAIASLRERAILGWDRRTAIPLKDITYEGGDAEHPQMTFAFTKEVEFGVRNGINMKSLIISVKTNVATQTDGVEETISEVNKEKMDGERIGKSSVIEKDIEAIIPDEIDIVLKKNEDDFMEMAKMAMIEGRYSRAIRYYTKVIRKAEGEIRKQAQELLGLARERKGQLARAKSEYKKYLNRYPLGSDAERVGQRLAGLLTAAKEPKKRIVKVKKPKKTNKKPKWRIRNYGSYSNFFYRNQTLQEGRDTRVNRNDLYTNFDLNSRWISEDYDIRYKYTARHQSIFLPDKENQGRLSALSVEIRHKKSDLYGKIGRQSRHSGGVLGRFDGAHISYDISPKVVINGVFGFPVESTKKTNINTEKKFFGISADFGTFNGHWDYTAFFIAQDNRGMIDRCAIGGEVRYFDPKKSFFTLIDYDIFFNTVNIFSFNGHWTLPSKTTLNLMCNYRRSPLLMTNNAIQGQGVMELDDLFGRYTDDELKSLAMDRSAISKSFTFGVTQQINDDIQLTGNFTVSRQEGTVASGGVDAVPGAGNQYYSSLQLNINNIFFKNDSIINGLRYSNTSRRNAYTYNIRARIPFSRKFRLIPKFQMDYRIEKGNDDKRLSINPKLRIDYRLKKLVRLEVEGGIKWVDNYSSGISSKYMETFFSAGYRINF